MASDQQLSPSLYGLKHTNKDFSLKESWGKNQFNTAFPTALGCYMHQKEVDPIYLVLNPNLEVEKKTIKVNNIYGIDPLANETFYAFENQYNRYQHLVNNGLPRIDLVINRLQNKELIPVRGIEIKLTALPDHTTFSESDENYGCEIVIRPDTIVYLALSIALKFQEEANALKDLISPHLEDIQENNWYDPDVMRQNSDKIISAIDAVLLSRLSQQEPFLLQPIWKTEGKTLILHENCLDIFVWSDYALTRLFIDVCKSSSNRQKITRHYRTAIWLAKMLVDFSKKGKIDQRGVINNLTYDTKNDKAFAVSGKITRKYMKSDQITSPRIKRKEIKNIILNGGERMLSPERRFDAAILGMSEIFV